MTESNTNDLHPLTFLLDAFQNVAQQRGFMLVKSNDANNFPREVKAEIGQAVLAAHWDYSFQSESLATRQRRMRLAVEAGTDTAYAEDIIRALAELGVVPRLLDAISGSAGEKDVVDIAYADEMIRAMAQIQAFRAINSVDLQ